jgi:predicted nucleic acid-binding protein
MMYLLDTNVASELRKVDVGTADPNVKAWSDALDAEAAFLSVITVLELEQGTLLMERRDSRQGAMLRAWLENRILPQFEGRILSVDLLVVQRCATLHVPDPKDDRDSLIAATALVHSMTVVTRNVSHFAPCGVKVFNPWEA